MSPVLVFDVLGTLLDPGRERDAWFAELVQRMMTSTIVGEHQVFEELDARGLPPYPDVPPALERLARAGYGMHALGDGSRDATRAQLAEAGIAQYFHGIHSAQTYETYKPDVRVYRTTLVRIDVAPADAIMISAHPWDLAGARRHGMRTTLVQRPGHDLGAVADALQYFPVTSGLA